MTNLTDGGQAKRLPVRNWTKPRRTRKRPTMGMTHSLMSSMRWWLKKLRNVAHIVPIPLSRRKKFVQTASVAFIDSVFDHTKKNAQGRLMSSPTRSTPVDDESVKHVTIL